MNGFAKDSSKMNVPIGSGLTKVTVADTGMKFFMGLHEAPYLENNEHLLFQQDKHGNMVFGYQMSSDAIVETNA